jgi:hypothetical protein
MVLDPTLLGLPNEVLYLHILKYLDDRDVNNLAKTCKVLYNNLKYGWYTDRRLRRFRQTVCCYCEKTLSKKSGVMELSCLNRHTYIAHQNCVKLLKLRSLWITKPTRRFPRSDFTLTTCPSQNCEAQVIRIIKLVLFDSDWERFIRRRKRLSHVNWKLALNLLQGKINNILSNNKDITSILNVLLSHLNK